VILDLSKAISLKRCKIRGKLVLITNRKSHMSFRLVRKSVTLNDLERRNGRYFALFHRIRVRCRRKTITSVSKFTFGSVLYITILMPSGQLFSDYLGKTNSDNLI